MFAGFYPYVTAFSFFFLFRTAPKYFATSLSLLSQDLSFLGVLTDMLDCGILELRVSPEQQDNSLFIFITEMSLASLQGPAAHKVGFFYQ